MHQTDNNYEYLYTLEQQIQLLTKQVESLKEIIDNIQSSQTKEWMNIKEACSYMGVAYNTFSKYRDLGLKIYEIEGVKRVSKKEIDEFLAKVAFKN